MAVGDNLVALQVKSNLLANEDVGLLDIDVDVQDGVAILSGEVDTEEQKQIAQEMALKVDGVDSVDNEISVVPPPEGEDTDAETTGHLGYGLAEGSAGNTAYGIGNGYTPPGSGFPASEQFPGEYNDEQVLVEINDRLEDQGFVDVSLISVKVDNQIAYLSGKVKTVDDLNQLQDLVMNARGVMGVDVDEVSVEEGEIGTPAS